MTRYNRRVKVQNATCKKGWENSLPQIFRTLFSVDHSRLFLTYHLFFNAPDSRLHAECWVGGEIRICLQTAPFSLENLKTFTFYNNTQMQSSFLLLLSTLKFVIAVSLRTNSHLLNYMVKKPLFLLVILCSIL